MDLRPFPLLLALFCTLPASAGLTLGAPFSEHMVVQADRPVPVWGRDEPGTGVTVRLGDATATATCGDDGRWRVDLPAVGAGGPLSLVASGTSQIVLEDVLAGDVWWCSGQSNMHLAVAKSDSAASVQAAPVDPQLRLMKLPLVSVDEPLDAIDARWAPAAGGDRQGFSAVAYHFGAELRAETGRPIGLIQASWGGSGIQGWVSPARLAASPVHDDVLKRRAVDEAAYVERLAAWEDGGKQGKKPDPGGAREQHRLSGMHNGMVAPFVGLPLRGVIWYQGESDVSRVAEYEALFPSLLADWREDFITPDLPAFIVQLPGFSNPQWPAFREMQRRLAEELPGVDMAVTIDVGDPDDIHPTNKQPVGGRLARLALADAYGTGVLAGGPRVVAVEADAANPGVVRVRFDRVGGGLASSAQDGSLSGFTFKDNFGRTVVAEATIESADTLLVRADGVKRPSMLLYAHEADPHGSLVNGEALPASPFLVRITPAGR